MDPEMLLPPGAPRSSSCSRSRSMGRAPGGSVGRGPDPFAASPQPPDTRQYHLELHERPPQAGAPDSDESPKRLRAFGRYAPGGARAQSVALPPRAQSVAPGPAPAYDRGPSELASQPRSSAPQYAAAPAGGGAAALLIGTDYVDSGQPLWGCAQTARSLPAFLRRHGFPAHAQGRVLTDEGGADGASRAAISTGVRWLLSGRRAGDELFLSFTGRAAAPAGGVLPADHASAGPLPEGEVVALLSALPPGARVWVVCDCADPPGALAPLPYSLTAGRDPDSGQMVLNLTTHGPPIAGSADEAARISADVIMLSMVDGDQAAAPPFFNLSLSAPPASGGVLTAAFTTALSFNPRASMQQLLADIWHIMRQCAGAGCAMPRLSSTRPFSAADPYPAFSAGPPPPQAPVPPRAQSAPALQHAASPQPVLPRLPSEQPQPLPPAAMLLQGAWRTASGTRVVVHGLAAEYVDSQRVYALQALDGGVYLMGARVLGPNPDDARQAMWDDGDVWTRDDGSPSPRHDGGECVEWSLARRPGGSPLRVPGPPPPGPSVVAAPGDAAGDVFSRSPAPRTPAEQVRQSQQQRPAQRGQERSHSAQPTVDKNQVVSRSDWTPEQPESTYLTPKVPEGAPPPPYGTAPCDTKLGEYHKEQLVSAIASKRAGAQRRRGLDRLTSFVLLRRQWRRVQCVGAGLVARHEDRARTTTLHKWRLWLVLRRPTTLAYRFRAARQASPSPPHHTHTRVGVWWATAKALHADLSAAVPGRDASAAVFAKLSNIRTEEEWTALDSTFRAMYPEFHRGDLNLAMTKHLPPAEVKRCRDVLRASGVSAEPRGITDHSDLVEQNVASMNREKLQPSWRPMAHLYRRS